MRYIVEAILEQTSTFIADHAYLYGLESKLSRLDRPQLALSSAQLLVKAS